MPDPTLLTIVLNWRTPAMTLEAAEAALREMAGIAGGLIIVDNNSQDGSFETMAAAAEARGWTEGGRVRVLQSGRNGGFGAGNNAGIRAGLARGAAPDYVYLLNSDAFPDPGAIRALLDHLEAHPEVGLAGSYIHGPDGEPHLTAFRFPSLWSEFEGAARTGPITRLLARHVVPLPIPERTVPVDWLAGASVMMRRRALDEIGLFDERFFLYFEETDLCRRARAAGWPTAYVRESEVTHIGSVSTGMKTWARTPELLVQLAPALLRQEPRGGLRGRGDARPSRVGEQHESFEPGERVAARRWRGSSTWSRRAPCSGPAACRTPRGPEPRPPRPDRVACGARRAPAHEPGPRRRPRHSPGAPRAAPRGAPRAGARRSPRW